MLQQPLEKPNRRLVSSVHGFPPPIGGWVDASNENYSSPGYAAILQNFVPTANSVKLRNGCVRVNKVPLACRSLISYVGNESSKLLGSSGSEMYTIPFDVSEPIVITPPTLIGSGFTNDNWSSVSMANAADEVAIVMVNGFDGVWRYDGTGDMVEVTTTPDIKSLVAVTSHKGRLWFVDRTSSVVYYGDVLSNAPITLTAFPIGPFMKKGGNLVGIASWSRDGGSGPDDLLVFVSSRGEIIVFSGIDPADDFALVGVFIGNKPVGRRCFKNIGTDLIFYSQYGPQVLTDIFTQSVNVNPMFAAVRDSFIEMAMKYPNAVGWDFMSAASDSWTIFNVPFKPPEQYHQFIMNVSTGAWFKVTGWNATSIVSHMGYDFFAKNDGNVYVMNRGGSDDGVAIQADFMSSWSMFEIAGNKKFNMCNISVKSDISPEVAVDMMIDYVVRVPKNTPPFPLKTVMSYWDEAVWDVALWSSQLAYYNQWFGVFGIGRAGALRYRLTGFDIYHELLSYSITVESGGLI